MKKFAQGQKVKVKIAEYEGNCECPHLDLLFKKFHGKTGVVKFGRTGESTVMIAGCEQIFWNRELVPA